LLTAIARAFSNENCLAPPTKTTNKPQLNNQPMSNHHLPTTQSIKHISNIHNHTPRVLAFPRYFMWTGHEYLKLVRPYFVWIQTKP
jgi:hypothetical protein